MKYRFLQPVIGAAVLALLTIVTVRADNSVGGDAAYLVDAAGKLTLLARPGSAAPAPSIGMALNNKGQVAFPVHTQEGQTHLVLATPVPATSASP